MKHALSVLARVILVTGLISAASAEAKTSANAPLVKTPPRLTVITADPQTGYSLSGVSLGMTPFETTIALMGRYPDELQTLTAQYRVTTPTYCERRQVLVYPDYRRYEKAPLVVPCDQVVPGTLSDDRGNVRIETYYQADDFQPNTYISRLSRSNGVYVITVWFSERVDASLSKPEVTARASRIEMRFMNPEPDPADTLRFYDEAVRKFGPPVVTKTSARNRKVRAGGDTLWCLNDASAQPPICGGKPYLRMSADARRLQLIDQTDYDARIQAYLDWQGRETRRPQF